MSWRNIGIYCYNVLTSWLVVPVMDSRPLHGKELIDVRPDIIQFLDTHQFLHYHQYILTQYHLRTCPQNTTSDPCTLPLQTRQAPNPLRLLRDRLRPKKPRVFPRTRPPWRCRFYIHLQRRDQCRGISTRTPECQFCEKGEPLL